MTKDFIVTITKTDHHNGDVNNVIKVKLSFECPKCKALRAINMYQFKTIDNGKILFVDGWDNTCKHIDTYEEIRKEGKIVPFETPSTFDIFIAWALKKGFIPHPPGWIFKTKILPNGIYHTQQQMISLFMVENFFLESINNKIKESALTLSKHKQFLKHIKNNRGHDNN